MKQAKALAPRDLERKHAPRMLEPPRFPLGSAALHPLLHVELVEGKDGHARLREWNPGVLHELVDRRKVRQLRGFVHQMPESDKRVSLATAIGQLQLAD